jgi:hypothetical protein
VRREADKQDRRKVIVVPDEQKIYADIGPHSTPMGTALEGVYAEFSDGELETILAFVSKANAVAADVISKARQGK